MIREGFLWWFLLQALAWATLPLGFFLFRKKLELLTGISKTLGIFGLGGILWCVGMTTAYPVDRMGTVAFIAVFAVVSWVIFLKRPEWSECKEWLIKEKRSLLLTEFAFLLFYLFFLYLRAKSPDIAGTEKGMEQAFLSSILRSTHLPPEDPWFSGHGIPYYYLGYFSLGVPAKILGIGVARAFNLAAATVPALTLIGAFRLVKSMGGALGLNKKNTVLAAFFSVWLLGFSTNLGGALLYLHSWKRIPTSWMEKIDAPSFYGFSRTNFESLWKTTRIVQDHSPDGGSARVENIHEYPFFSHLLSDLHPHWMSLPYWMLLLSLAFLFFHAPPALGTRWVAFGLACAFGALINSWDLPLITLIFLLLTPKMGLRNAALAGLGMIIPLALFRISYTPPVSGLALFGGSTNPLQALLAYSPMILFSLLLLPSLIRLAKNKEMRFVFAIAVFSIVLLLIPELFFLRDAFGNRMNTVFKLSFESWILGSLLFPLIALKMEERKARWLITVYFLITLPVFLSNVLERMRSPAFSLDGWNSLRLNEPARVEAATWLDAQALDGDLMVEAPSDSYSGGAMLSSMTGIPSYLGWKGHEAQWRGWTEELNQRASDLSAFYSANDARLLAEWLEKKKVRFFVAEGANQRIIPDPRFKLGFDSPSIRIYLFDQRSKQ